MQTAKRVIKNTVILYAKIGITLFISLYSTRLILNALGVNDFGIFNVVGGIVTMLTFLNTAMASATQRYMSLAEGQGDIEKQRQIFNVSIILHFLTAIGVGFILLIAGLVLFDNILNISESRLFSAKIIYYFMIVSTMFTIMSVPYDAVINAHENMLYYSIVGIFESFLKLIVAIVLVQSNFDKLVVYGFLMACISIMIMVVLRIYCHRKYRECLFSPKNYYKPNLMKDMTKFAGWSFAETTTSMVGHYGMGVVLNHFFGSVLNAAQGISTQLNAQLLIFSSTMMKALNPVIVKSEGSGERNDMLRMSLMGCKFSFYLFAFFAIPFLIETPFILKMWLKNVPEWTTIFCRYAIARTLLDQLTLPLKTSINAVGKIRNISVVKSILNVIVLPIIYLTFLFGSPPSMMYIVTLIIWGVFEGVITIYYTIKNCNLRLIDYLKFVLNRSIVVFLPTLLVGIMPLLFFSESIARVLLVVSISSFSFIFLFIRIGLTKEESSFLSSLISKLLNNFIGFFNKNKIKPI